MMVELVTVQIMVLWGGICAFALWIIHKLDKIESKLGDAEKYKELQIIPDDVITAHDINYWKEIVKQLEHRKKHPQAFNYAQFEVWVTDILNGGNGFPIPSLGDENDT